MKTKKERDQAVIDSAVEYNRLYLASTQSEKERLFRDAMDKELTDRHYKTARHYSRKHGR